MKIEDLIESDERVIWQDHPAGPGARRVPPGWAAMIFDAVLPGIALAFVALGLGLAALVLDGMLVRLACGAGAVATLAMLVLISGNALKDRRFRARSEPHYVLTSQRLIAWDEADGWRTQILPGALEAVVRRGRNLEIYIHSDDDALTLYTLADIDAAERAISAVLAPAAPGERRQAAVS